MVLLAVSSGNTSPPVAWGIVQTPASSLFSWWVASVLGGFVPFAGLWAPLNHLFAVVLMFDQKHWRLIVFHKSACTKCTSSYHSHTGSGPILAAFGTDNVWMPFASVPTMHHLSSSLGLSINLLQQKSVCVLSQFFWPPIFRISAFARQAVGDRIVGNEGDIGCVEIVTASQEVLYVCSLVGSESTGCWFELLIPRWSRIQTGQFQLEVGFKSEVFSFGGRQGCYLKNRMTTITNLHAAVGVRVFISMYISTPLSADRGSAIVSPSTPYSTIHTGVMSPQHSDWTDRQPWGVDQDYCFWPNITWSKRLQQWANHCSQTASQPIFGSWWQLVLHSVLTFCEWIYAIKRSRSSQIAPNSPRSTS